MKTKLFYEEVTERVAGVITASNIRPATRQEVKAARLLHRQGRCPHTIVRDTPGWPYDIRDCAICGEGLGLV
jgi:hypothetical protein